MRFAPVELVQPAPRGLAEADGPVAHDAAGVGEELLLPFGTSSGWGFVAVAVVLRDGWERVEELAELLPCVLVGLAVQDRAELSKSYVIALLGHDRSRDYVGLCNRRAGESILGDVEGRHASGRVTRSGEDERTFGQNCF